MDDPLPETFGQRMARLKRERGQNSGGPGRPRIADKHGRYVNQAEAVFARQMPAEAERYIAELDPKEPEVCEIHGRILACPVERCQTISQRTAYDFKAAAYLFDRIMGKPTARTENTVTVKLVNELTTAFVAAFIEVNHLDDADTRQAAFAERLRELGTGFGGAAA
ncbi:MAG: hypothetical protein AB7R89_25690 [Dehalococcoidia bacterium]